jgi:hypothetical protein
MQAGAAAASSCSTADDCLEEKSPLRTTAALCAPSLQSQSQITAIPLQTAAIQDATITNHVLCKEFLLSMKMQPC